MIKNTIRKCAAILILVSLVGCGQNKGVNNQSKAETTKEETVTKSQIETGENQDVENTQSTTDTSQNEEKSKTTAVKNAKTERFISIFAVCRKRDYFRTAGIYLDGKRPVRV